MGKNEDEDMMSLLGFKYGQQLKPQPTTNVQPQTKAPEPQPTIPQQKCLPELPDNIRFSKSTLQFRLLEAIAEATDEKLMRLLVDANAFVEYSYPLVRDKDGKMKPSQK